MPLLLELYLRFFYVGLFSVGGGLATLPFLREIGEKTQWFTPTQLSDLVAVSESTPGPMGINMATYIGYTTAGIPGSLIAVLGEITPAIVIILLVSRVLLKFRQNNCVQWAFYGLRAASVGLIAVSCLSVAQLALFKTEVFTETGSFFAAVNYWALALAAVVFLGLRLFKKVHPIVFIALGAAAGIAFHWITQ